MSYPFYLIMVAYGRAAEGVYETQIAWLPAAVGITVLALAVSCARYARLKGDNYNEEQNFNCDFYHYALMGMNIVTRIGG